MSPGRYSEAVAEARLGGDFVEHIELQMPMGAVRDKEAAWVSFW
jgi:hypothetical protein